MVYRLKYSQGGVWGIFRFTSENICSDVSASSVFIYSACGCCPSGTSKKSWHWDIKLFTLDCVCLHVFKYRVLCRLVSNSQIWNNIWDLAPAAPRPKPMCCLVYFYVCFIHRFLSAVRLRSQCQPFSIWADGKWCKSLLSPKSTVLSCLLLYISPIESLHVR